MNQTKASYFDRELLDSRNQDDNLECDVQIYTSQLYIKQYTKKTEPWI